MPHRLRLLHPSPNLLSLQPSLIIGPILYLASLRTHTEVAEPCFWISILSPFPGHSGVSPYTNTCPHPSPYQSSACQNRPQSHAQPCLTVILLHPLLYTPFWSRATVQQERADVEADRWDIEQEEAKCQGAHAPPSEVDTCVRHRRLRTWQSNRCCEVRATQRVRW